MHFDLKATSSGVALTLHGRLGVQQARPLWDALSAAVVEGKTIRLDASKVEEIDTSIAQILCRCGGQLQVGEASDEFMAALQLRGLESCFAQERMQPVPAPKPRSKRLAKPARKAA
jgi:ABC-type transporter Mla MlaB component